MKKFRVTKLPMATVAIQQLQSLPLSPGDVDLILCYGEKQHYGDQSFIWFNNIFASPHKKLSRLEGVNLVMRQ